MKRQKIVVFIHNNAVCYFSMENKLNSSQILEEQEKKKENAQKRWQAGGEGYVGSVEEKDEGLYNQMRVFTLCQPLTSLSDEQFWME